MIVELEGWESFALVEEVRSLARDRRAGCHDAERSLAADRLSIELVFTAHPSEAKRRSIRAKLRRMRHSLQELDRGDLLPRERSAHESDLHTELDVLWQTEFLRPFRPTVFDEVERGLSIMPRLWEAIPRVHALLRQGLAACYPGCSFQISPFLTFGSWMGGDRDGNPFFTADVTERTLLRLRAAAIERHLDWCARLHNQLTISLHAARNADLLFECPATLAALWPDLAAVLEPHAADKTYRRWIRMIRFRLERSQADSLAEPAAPAVYASGSELEADVALLVECLRHDHGLADHSPATHWLDLVRTVGLHMTRLDVRQDARAYGDIMREIPAAAGHVADAAAFTALDEPARQALLVHSMPTADGQAAAVAADLSPEGVRPLAGDTLRLFEVLHRAVARFGPECVAAAIISLTRSPADVLAVLWLWRHTRG